MCLTRTHLLRVSLPALTLLLGLFWYRRRRVAPADPGGSDEDEKPENVAPLTEKPVEEKEEKKQVEPEIKSQEVIVKDQLLQVLLNPVPSPASLCDSGITTDDSFSLNLSTTLNSPVVSSSVAVTRTSSESVSIPNKNVTRASWYEEDEIADTKIEVIKLGSNPSASEFNAPKKTPQKINKSRNQSKNRNKRNKENAKVVKMTGKVVDSNEMEPKKKQNAPEEVATSDKHDHQTTTAVSERDSANHSPVSGVLEGSVNDEARSEGSTDSGKGGSIKGNVHKSEIRNLYEFAVPIKYVGKFIGKGGSFLKNIKTTTGCYVNLKRHMSDKDAKLCALTGSLDGINMALSLIRQNFPEKDFPEFTLEPVNQIIKEIPEEFSFVPELVQLSLVEGVNNDVIICNILEPNHFFVQLPTHPTYIRLKELDERMTVFYDSVESPGPPEELWNGMILVAKWYDRWIRVSIETPDPSGNHSLVKMVDHGGYWTFSNAEMRKIHSDFLTLPFQAIEVFLANCQPKEGGWTQEAFDVVTQMCSGTVALAQIEGYVDCSMFISLYFSLSQHGVISLAEELKARDLALSASLLDIEPTTPEA